MCCVGVAHVIFKRREQRLSTLRHRYLALRRSIMIPSALATSVCQHPGPGERCAGWRAAPHPARLDDFQVCANPFHFTFCALSSLYPNNQLTFAAVVFSIYLTFSSVLRLKCMQAIRHIKRILIRPLFPDLLTPSSLLWTLRSTRLYLGTCLRTGAR